MLASAERRGRAGSGHPLHSCTLIRIGGKRQRDIGSTKKTGRLGLHTRVREGGVGEVAALDTLEMYKFSHYCSTAAGAPAPAPARACAAAPAAAAAAAKPAPPMSPPRLDCRNPGARRKCFG